MIPASRATVVIVSASHEDRWSSLIVAAVKKHLKNVPSSAIDIESWSSDQLGDATSKLIERGAPVALLLLMTPQLAEKLEERQSEMIALQSGPVWLGTFRVDCEAPQGDLAWLDRLTVKVGPDRPLTALPPADLPEAIANIADAATSELVRKQPPDGVADLEPSSAAPTNEPLSRNTEPLSRLSEFRTADSIAFLFKQAGRLAAAPDRVITTSSMLFGIAEASGQGQWAAPFLREALNRLGKDYQGVRDRYVAGQGVPARRSAKESARGGQPTTMSANMFAILQRAAQLAERTTEERTIHARHLVAALLIGTEPPRDFGVMQRLKELQIDPVALRTELYDWMRGYGDRDAAWAALLSLAASLTRRLGGFSADRGLGSVDLLGIDGDVQALAALIASRTVSPPLSIGLFGEWGTGKTFFMRSLRTAIDGLSEDARNANQMQRDLPFYKNISQIEFNAWHYVEGNLWASLVEHILNNLYARKDPNITRQLQEGLIKKLADETALAQTTNNAVASAQAATQNAKEDLAKAQRELDDKAAEVAKLNATTVLKDFQLTGAAAPVGKALQGLGFDKVGNSAAELEGALRRINEVLGRGQRLLTPLVRGRDRGRRLLWLALSLLGAPVVAMAVNYLLGELPRAEIYAYATGVATLISTAVPWINRQAAWLAQRLDEAETAQRAFDAEMVKATAAQVEEVSKAEQKLRELMSTFEAAQRKHAEAKGREAAAEAELKAATTGRLLANFISDRAASSDYRKHLGMLALVRNDFEKLSGLIEEENWRLSPVDPSEAPRTDGLTRVKDLAEEEQDDERRINRIVLYIDDLDRCPPNKVVDVLQAVHLLLAFPLFVVVVGVDARWVTKSLETRYRELLRIDSKAASSDDDVVLAGTATPNDYLEKIFQIPFWLKPMDSQACEQMVDGLLRATLSKAAGEPPPPLHAGNGVPAPDGAQPSRATQATGETESVTSTAAPPPAPAVGQLISVAAPRPKPPVLDLTISSDEVTYMKKLSGILDRSPRALKRFVNIYRLIKAGLEERDLQAFTRPRSPVADYQAVLFLLAIDTGTPLAARQFFDTLDAGAKGDEVVTINWLVEQIDKKTPKVAKDRGDWPRLRSWLTSQANAVPNEADLSVIASWTTRVGRHSFEIGRSV